MLGLAQFAIRDQDREKKLEFIFSIYDMDRDGFISNGELFQASTTWIGHSDPMEINQELVIMK